MAKRKGNYKAGPGRPQGTKKYPLRESIRLTEEHKQFLVEKYGGVSAGVRELIDNDSDSIEEENTHGGKREGAGRKSIHEQYGEYIIRTTVRLPESFYMYVKEIGDGDFSEGLRILISEHMEQDDG